VKLLPAPLLFWLAIAAAIILLAPYAGLHIVTSPPISHEQEDHANALAPPASVKVSNQQLPGHADGQGQEGVSSDSLADINGLLAE